MTGTAVAQTGRRQAVQTTWQLRVGKSRRRRGGGRRGEEEGDEEDRRGDASGQARNRLGGKTRAREADIRWATVPRKEIGPVISLIASAVLSIPPAHAWATQLLAPSQHDSLSVRSSASTRTQRRTSAPIQNCYSRTRGPQRSPAHPLSSSSSPHGSPQEHFHVALTAAEHSSVIRDTDITQMSTPIDNALAKGKSAICPTRPCQHTPNSHWTHTHGSLPRSSRCQVEKSSLKGISAVSPRSEGRSCRTVPHRPGNARSLSSRPSPPDSPSFSPVAMVHTALPTP
ncbi:uncharacterized protein FIBRA_00058 [Fibroporia radiculosa]|uniref:Uncharacterized protein n=1 Tax=Fibroporia radiculosa TaxID=599839 RepID=J7S5K1_9APHY|nr:uncharacterized protein FIBRA_00058 [Fibroporia radiculosa]CCL98064.1 predicted protein [Fibroporia radiculosa]